MFLFQGLLLAIFCTCLADNPAWAWRSPPPSYWAGPRFRDLPREHRVIIHGSNQFYFSYGRFYRRGPAGFVLAVPPFGVVVPALPVGFVTFVVGGLTYYELNGIYYRQVPEGYQVVEYPVVVDRAAGQPRNEAGAQLVVQSQLLNVRSGPGMDEEVITTVARGAIVKLIGNAPGWYYVELTDGERGWVQDKFLAPVRAVPEG